MYLARIRGTMTTTVKHETLTGCRFCAVCSMEASRARRLLRALRARPHRADIHPQAGSTAASRSGHNEIAMFGETGVP